MKCTAHPNIETVLACSKCGKPICPKCLVQTPVGARCRECARLEKPPTYAVSSVYLLRAVLAGLGVAVASGIIWIFINAYVRFFLSFDILLAGAAGYVIAEAISRATNHKRGPALAFIAAAGVFLAFTISHGLFWFIPTAIGLGYLFDLAAVVLGIVIAVNRLR
jgi:hypothetical protein